MSSSSSKTSLTLAANVLQNFRHHPLDSQIDALSNVLTGTQRKRKLQFDEKGLPADIKNVLEILKLQIAKAISSLLQAKKDQNYRQFIEELEIIEAFTEKITKFYLPSKEKGSQADQELKKSVKQSFLKAKSEAITALQLQKILTRVEKLERQFKNTPEMTRKEYRMKLEEFFAKVSEWEDDLLPSDPLLQNSQVILEKIYELKDKLHLASEISQRPQFVAEKGLEILRLAGNLIQYAKSQFEMEQALLMATQANQKLKRCETEFQELGRNFNLLIEEHVAKFIDRNLRSLELELKSPLYYYPKDAKKNAKVANRQVLQMGRLITYFNFIDKWAGSHQEDLLERLAMIYEKIVERSEKAKFLILDDASKNGLTKEEAEDLAEVAAKFCLAERMGKDKIKPHEIFHEKVDVNAKIQKILDQLPDPSLDLYLQPFHKLGAFHYETIILRTVKDSDKDSQEKIQSLLSRINFYVSKQECDMDIYLEKIVRKKYMTDQVLQETLRFITLMGVEPSVTTAKKYEKYKNLGKYPFKGAEFHKVLNSWRILDNLLHAEYGFVEKRVINDLYKDWKSFDQKVLLLLLKHLNLSIVNPPPIDVIDEHLQKQKDKRLSLMLEYVMDPENLREKKIKIVKEQFFAICKEHKTQAEKIISSFIASDPEFVKKAVIETLSLIIHDAERVTFTISEEEITKLNEDKQFEKDHQIPEILPFYVEGALEKRKKNEDIYERLLKSVSEEKTIAEKVSSLATSSLFQVGLEKIDHLFKRFLELVGKGMLSIKLDECQQYFTFNKDKNIWLLTGLGQLIVEGPGKETGQTDELASLIMKIAIEITKDKNFPAKVSFIDKPFHFYVSQLRNGRAWALF